MADAAIVEAHEAEEVQPVTDARHVPGERLLCIALHTTQHNTTHAFRTDSPASKPHIQSRERRDQCDRVEGSLDEGGRRRFRY